MTVPLGGFVHDTARLIRKRFDAAVRHYNVTGAQWRALLLIDRMPGVNQGQLAEMLEVEAITTCRMIDRLVQSGMVERRADPTDRRAWNLHVAQAARPLIGQVNQIAGEVMGRAFSGFSDQEKLSLQSMLDRLRSNLLDDSAFASEQVRRNGIRG